MMKGWYGNKYGHSLASKGIRSKKLKASGIKVYRLYYINDETGKEYIEQYGTFEECLDTFDDWFIDHIEQFDKWGKEELNEYMKEFYENPKKKLWERNNEIYSDWYLEEIYETKD